MQGDMQTLDCNVGTWRAHAHVQEVETGKLMAVISVTDDSGKAAGDSRHTVVFEHQPGYEPLEETRLLVQRLLQERYGI
ncbi:MAG: hypothetical protein JWQ00_2379 [Noviherbaspirillum sp.]|jgi:hypothetical protein|nr:hypothetical protein [Noviherbaspirillum sp.]